MASAGKYRDRITLYAPAPQVKTPTGGFAASGAEPSLETWADVRPLQAKTFFVDGKMVNKQPFKITIRYVNDPSMRYYHRVEWNGISIGVASVTPDAKNTEITIYGYGLQ